MVHLHSAVRVQYSEQLGVSFQTGKIRFEPHIKWGYSGSIGLRQKLYLSGLLFMHAISLIYADFRKQKQRNIAYDNDIQMFKPLSIRLKTNSTSISLWAHPSKVKIISHKKRLKTNRRRYLKAPLHWYRTGVFVLNGYWFRHPVYSLTTWQCTLSYRSVLLNYNVATESSRKESWDDESRRVPISALQNLF